MSDGATFWSSLDRLLDHSSINGIRVHKVGPLAAWRLRERNRSVPRALLQDERAAAVAAMTATPLLERTRSVCDGPLVLFKGPEVARVYPGGARSFSDLDLLTPDAISVHEALKAAGFVEVDDPTLFVDHHHLRPLRWPTLALNIEIHRAPAWPDALKPPSTAEILEGATPSPLGVEGILAPATVHHALILAAHGWAFEPLGRLRDLIDVAAVAAGASESELDSLSRVWGVERIWRTTRGAAAALLEGGSSPAVRMWGRHLRRVEERTVFENHLLRLLHPFWEVPPSAALARTTATIAQQLRPEKGEGWRRKARRVSHAIRNARAPMSSHEVGSRREPEKLPAEGVEPDA